MINRTRVNYHSSEYEGDYNLANRSTVWIKPPTHSLTCVVCLFVFNEVNNINASIHPGHVSKDKILPLLPCASSSCGFCQIIIIIMRTYFRGWLKVFNDADDSGGWPQFMIYRITDFRAQTQESRDLWKALIGTLLCEGGRQSRKLACVIIGTITRCSCCAQSISHSPDPQQDRAGHECLIGMRTPNFHTYPPRLHAQFVKEGTH